MIQNCYHLKGINVWSSAPNREMICVSFNTSYCGKFRTVRTDENAEDIWTMGKNGEIVSSTDAYGILDWLEEVYNASDLNNEIIEMFIAQFFL